MPRTMRDDLRELAIGEKIRRIRQERKITIQQLAEKAGLSKGLISQIENEQVSPPHSDAAQDRRQPADRHQLFFP